MKGFEKILVKQLPSKQEIKKYFNDYLSDRGDVARVHVCKQAIFITVHTKKYSCCPVYATIENVNFRQCTYDIVIKNKHFAMFLRYKNAQETRKFELPNNL